MIRSVSHLAGMFCLVLCLLAATPGHGDSWPGFRGPDGTGAP